MFHRVAVTYGIKKGEGDEKDGREKFVCEKLD